MKEIILDGNLIANKINPSEFEARYFFKDCKGFELLDKPKPALYHMNYLRYLAECWKNHYGVIISPTIFWNMVLNNLAYKVNKTPDVFRKYFTESDEKQEICVEQGGNKIDVTLLIAGVASVIPGEILDHVFPKYSTDTEKSTIANYTAFLDMVSPYYNYSMYLCGIPKVRVLGTEEDWALFYKKLNEIATRIPEFCSYLQLVGYRLAQIIDITADFSKMFRLDRCGSGSQVEVEGWIKEFFIEQPSVNYPENFISCISKIDYHNYNDGKDYRLYAGLFTSTIEDGYLLPEFDNMYFQKINPTEAITKKAVDDKIILNLQSIKVESEIRKLRTKWDNI
jgi:hypothetical protein